MGINSPKSVIVVASGCPAELIQELLNGRTLPQQTDFAVLLPPGEQKQYDNLINRNSLRKTQFLSKPSKGFFSINYLRWLWDNLRSAENTYVLITKSPYQDPIVALISLTVLMLSDKAITLLFATPEAVIDLNGQGLSERWISQELNFKILVSEFYRIFWFLNPWNILYFFMIGGLILRQSLAKIMGRCLTRNRNQKNLTGTQEQEVLRKKYQDGGDDNPKPPYRVLHVIDQLGIGGAQEVVCQLVKYSQHDLFHPEVLALRGLGRYMDVLQSWGVPVYSLLPENHKIYSYFGGLSAHLLSKLFLFLTTRRYDLVHTHLLWSNMYATPMAAFCRVPVRFNHDQAYDFVRYRTGSNRFLRAISNRLTSHIIAVSYSIRNFLCQEENVSADKITVVHNSVDLNLFSPQNGLATRERMRKKWDLPPGALIVGGVGRLEQQKNFSLFLEVAAEVCAQLPQARFVIAGEGHDRSLLEDLSRKLGIEGKVRFPGFVKEMPEFYQSVDLLLLTSDFEGTPLTVLEALAMGLPVVASKVDGSAEILEDGTDAFLVPPKDKELFVDRVYQMLADRDLAQRLAWSGQEKVRYSYSAKDMVRQVEALYLKFLEKGGASA